MKKFLPFVILAIGALVLIGVVIARSRTAPAEPVENEDEVVAEIPVDQRPFVSLIPRADGHELKLRVEGTRVVSAETLDYELLYKVKDGRTQGVPGTVSVKGGALVERDLLLGTESSGKFRYDDGVEFGTLTLRFRNGSGKLVGKLITDFHLQTNTTELSSKDGKFTYVLSKTPKGVWFVTMMPFSQKTGAVNLVVQEGDYAVFASDSKSYPGKVQ